MLISEDLLLLHGATITALKCLETLFIQNDIPEYYYQLVSGTIKLTHYDNGTEIITDLLEKGAGIAEFLLFINKRYPFNAVTCEFCKILQLPKSSFLKLLEDNPEVQLNIIKHLYIDIEKKS